MSAREMVHDVPTPAPGLSKGTREYRHLTAAMLLAGLTTFAQLYAVQPLLPAFAGQFGLSAEASSLAVSCATAPLAFAILVAGVASDRVGRRPLMVAATLASACLTIGTALAPDWHLLLVLRLLVGLALAGVPAVAMAYISEEVEPRSAGSATGLYIAGTAIGGMAGRLGCGIVAEFAGWRWAVGSVGIMALVIAEAFRRLAPPSRQFIAARERHLRLGEALRDPALRLLYLEGFLLMGLFVTIYNYVTFRLIAPPYHLSQASVSMLFLLYLFGSASSARFGTLAGRHGHGQVFWVAVVCILVGIALTAAASLLLIASGIALITIGFFGGHSVASSWIARRSVDNRAQASAVYLFCYYMGSSLLGYLGGVAWSRAGWQGITLFCGFLGLAALGGALILARMAPLHPLRRI